MRFITFIALIQLKVGINLVFANYLLTVLEFEVLVKNDTSFFNIDDFKLKRKSRNETHKFYGKVIFHQEIGDKIQFISELYKKQGGEYRKTPYHLKGSFCDLIAMDHVVWPSFSDALGLPRKVNNFNQTNG